VAGRGHIVPVIGSKLHVMRVLVVEDEQKVADALHDGLEREGFEVVVERTGEGAFFRVTTETFDVVLLDLGLPGRSGIEILSAVRQRGLKTPVLVVTARDTVQDRVIGLDAGADDYLVKPFSVEELLARLRAVLRRRRPDVSDQMRVADLEIDLRLRTVIRGGKEISLTNREFALLAALAEASPRPVSKTTLIERVWDQHFDSGTNVLNVYVNYLRKKIDLPGLKPLVHTMRGIGFALREEAG
jgi:DNA-binding response OmpR family regulator